LALDEPKEADERLTVDGFQYLVDKDLFAMVQPITIDFTPMGFQVSGNLNTTKSAGGCGTCR
jgi:Fe-S cluster assembly iron-binding protein IscA